MTLLAPLWLLLLVPWLGLAVWMLRARGRDVEIPFLQLWRNDQPATTIARGRRVPPSYVLLILLALLAIIFALSRPIILTGLQFRDDLTLIVDRGDSMPPDAPSQLASRVRPFLANPIDLQLVPGGQPMRNAMGGSIDELQEASSTAIDTRNLIERAIRDALRERSVIALTGHQLTLNDPGLTQVPPDGVPTNIGIQRVAFRPQPAPQVMIRILNQSSLTQAVLHVDDLDPRPIQLPPPRQSQDYFIDLPARPSKNVLHVRLEAKDELPFDNQAWLLRERSPARIEVSGEVTPAVRRMMDVYTRLRPLADGSPRVVVSTGEFPPGAAVRIEPNLPDMISGALQITPHPITADIDWSKLAGDLRIASASPPADDGWQPLVRTVDRPILAVHPLRNQIWVGFDAESLASDPAFVVLWTNILDFLAGPERWGGHPPHTLPPIWRRIAPEPLPDDVQPGWLPGLYQNSETGRQIAINAPARLIDDPPQPDWQQSLRQLAFNDRGGWSFWPLLLILALALLLVAISLWPARRPSPVPMIPENGETIR